MVILGIDPGTATTGYGVIETSRPKHEPQDRNEKAKVIDFGCIITAATEKPGDRLHAIHTHIGALIEQHRPDIISIESLFFFKNATTAMPVAQAKGVVLLAAAQKKVPVLEFTPLQVKMTVVGYGRAEKKQVQAMTKQLLDLSNFDPKANHRKKDDAADALGIALCAMLYRPLGT